MNSKNNTSKILLGLAILGFILLFLVLGGNHRLQTTTRRMDATLLYPLLIGTLLILPYFIHLFFSKPNVRKKLKGNLNRSPNSQGKNSVEVFVLNESEETIIVNRKSDLDQNQWYIFPLKKNEPLYFSNGVVFSLNKNGDVVVQDFRNQVLKLAVDDFRKYDVPHRVNWAYMIAKPDDSDLTNES
jgi:hypothetical protein